MCVFLCACFCVRLCAHTGVWVWEDLHVLLFIVYVFLCTLAQFFVNLCPYTQRCVNVCGVCTHVCVIFVHICVCLWVCAHVCVIFCACTQVCGVWAQVGFFVHVCVLVHAYRCASVSGFVRTYVCFVVRVFVCMHTSVSVCGYIFVLFSCSYFCAVTSAFVLHLLVCDFCVRSWHLRFVKSAQMDGFQRHFDSQLLIYGKQTVLNLVRWVLPCSSEISGVRRGSASPLYCFCFQVNQKGSEKPLEEAFDKMVADLCSGLIKWVSASEGRMHAGPEADSASSVLSYIAFDFHKECSHMRWDRLQILVDAVAETQEEYRWVQTSSPSSPQREEALTPPSVCSYFMVNSDGKEMSHQSGVFRSNCMDCLDRTNVIQSLLARRSLQSQLQVSTTETATLVILLGCSNFFAWMNHAYAGPQRLGILNVGQRIEEQAEFEKTYKNGKGAAPAAPVRCAISKSVAPELCSCSLCVLSNQHGLTMPMHVLYSMQELEP